MAAVLFFAVFISVYPFPLIYYLYYHNLAPFSIINKSRLSFSCVEYTIEFWYNICSNISKSEEAERLWYFILTPVSAKNHGPIE